MTLTSFTGRYDRLREHAVSYLSQNYSKQEVQSALLEVIDRIVFGELPHAGSALRSLMGLRVALSDVSNAEESRRNATANRPAPQVSPALASSFATDVKPPSFPTFFGPGPPPTTSTRRAFGQATVETSPRATTLGARSGVWGASKSSSAGSTHSYLLLQHHRDKFIVLRL